MKTYLSIITVILLSSFSRAQNHDNYSRMFDLSKIWINSSNEKAWEFNQNNQFQIHGEYFDGYCEVLGDSLRLAYEGTDDDYYDDEEAKVVECYFQICKLSNNQLILHPLNIEAIRLIDFNDINEAESREVIFRSYLKELKGAGKDVKKRNLVVSNYKTKHELYVDTLKFFSQVFYFESVTIDSVDVSLSWIDLDGDKNIQRTQFNDLRWVPASNTYYFGYRFKDEKLPEYLEGQGLQFIPPVVVENADSERPPRKGEIQLKETAQDSLMRILDEAPAGWYTGKFDATGMLLLETSLQMYGLNKPHVPGDKQNCNYSVRVYHEGKYTDFYHTNSQAIDVSYLQKNFFEFLDSWSLYIRTFEESKSKTVVFPIGLK